MSLIRRKNDFSCCGQSISKKQFPTLQNISKILLCILIVQSGATLLLTFFEESRYKHRSNQVYQEELPSLLWKHGIATLSDKHDSLFYLINHNQQHQFENVTNMITNLHSGDIFAIQTEQVATFIKYVIPHIEQQEIYFTLIILTDTAKTIPIQIIYDEFDGNPDLFNHKILHNKYLLYIFCVNFDGLTWNYNNIIQNKIYPIPLGFDFHSSLKKLIFGHNKVLTPSENEKNVFQVLNKCENEFKQNHANSKIMKIYFDQSLIQHKMDKNQIPKNVSFLRFTTKQAYYGTTNDSDKYKHNYSYILDTYKVFLHSRKDYYRSWVYSQIMDLDKNEREKLFFIDQQTHNQYHGWGVRCQYAFSMSLLGMGLDCHRTYEALLFDNIVITLSSPLDILYKMYDLPVVIVENVREINESMLKYWYNKYKDKTYLNNAQTRKKLTSQYWIQFIKRKTQMKLQNVGI